MIKNNGLKQTDLKTLLRPNLHQLSHRQLQQFDAEPDIARIRRYVCKCDPKRSWESFRAEILTQFEHLLDIPLRPILIRSWDRHDDIKDISLTQHSSFLHNSLVVPLAAHTLRSQQQPKLLMQIEHSDNILLPLTIVLELSLSHVILKLKRGKIQRVMSGICKGSGSIHYGKTLLAKREIMGFRLTEQR